MYLLFLSSSFSFSDPSLHFLVAQGEIAKIKEEIDKGNLASQSTLFLVLLSVFTDLNLSNNREI